MTRTLALLERLIAFPTLSKASNLDLVDWVCDLLSNAGFSVTRLPSPDGSKAGVFARIGPDAPGGICLSGHSDVVPAEGQKWTRDAFQLTRDATHVYGRGTTDMKGFVACALHLAERAGVANLKTPLSVVLSYDEEIGCVGIRHMKAQLQPLLPDPRLVIVGEPTSMEIAVGHKGKAALEVTCTGQPGHSALAPRFVNAIHVAASCVTEVTRLQDSLRHGPQDSAYDIPYSTVHVGMIAGGRALNMVPDKTTLQMELRHLPEVPKQELIDAIQAVTQQIQSVYAPHGAASVREVNSYPGLRATQDARSLQIATSLTGQSRTKKVGFGTEAGVFAEMGLQTLVIGPGDMASDGHKPDESLSLEQLQACDAMMDRILDMLTD